MKGPFLHVVESNILNNFYKPITEFRVKILILLTALEVPAFTINSYNYLRVKSRQLLIFFKTHIKITHIYTFNNVGRYFKSRTEFSFCLKFLQHGMGSKHVPICKPTVTHIQHTCPAIRRRSPWSPQAPPEESQSFRHNTPIDSCNRDSRPKPLSGPQRHEFILFV